MNEIGNIAIELFTAAVLSAILGYDRERTHKSAGLRTHMLVGLAACFVTGVCRQAGFTSGDVSRVIQGLVTGIGFIGAGTILKLAEEKQIRGLTTAAGILMTTTIGVAAGLGKLGSAVTACAFGWFVLAVMVRIERHDGDSHQL